MKHRMRDMWTATRIVRSIASISALACIVPFALGTAPLPPPYYRYVVSGTVTWSDGTPAADVIMVMFTRTARDTALQMSLSARTPDERPIAVSYSDGTFVLSGRTRTDAAAESLAIGAIPAGKALRLDGAFHPDTSLANAVKGKGMNNTDVGCAGCGSEPSSYEYTVCYTTNISRNVVLSK